MYGCIIGYHVIQSGYKGEKQIVVMVKVVVHHSIPFVTISQ